LYCLPEKNSSWQEKKFELLDGILGSNPQVFPQECAESSRGELDWQATLQKLLEKIM
jgi:hypothetical protein